MPVYHFKLTPLSPVHVGAGESIAAEDYFLEGGKLTRFLPAAVVRAMTPQERQRYLGLLSGPPQQLDEALRMLREKAKHTSGAWIYSIDVGPEARQALAQVIDKLDTRRGDVRPLQWNLAKRVAILPGSAIKGAIRTALLSTLTAHLRQKAGGPLQSIESRLPQIDSFAGNSGRESREVARLAQELENTVLRRGGGIEKDPFRFLKVSDLEVPPQHVRLDRAALLAPSSSAQTKGIQMHFERLVSLLDSASPPVLDLSITIDQPEKEWHPAMKEYLQRFLEPAYLRSALNWHYRTRLLAEAEAKAFRDLSYGRLRDLLPDIVRQDSNAFILRLGRFSHFESLSVEGVRRTLNRRGKWVNAGSSRTYCGVDGSRKLPFGWVQLTLQGRLQ